MLNFKYRKLNEQPILIEGLSMTKGAIFLKTTARTPITVGKN